MSERALVFVLEPPVLEPPVLEPPPPAPVATPPASLAMGLLRTARPVQWVKNLLVFAAPGAAGVIIEGRTLARALLAFGVFCVAASGTYFLNDAADCQEDRLHRTKRLRPVAAGVVPERLAVACGYGLIGTSAVLAFLTLGLPFGAAVVAYVGVNVAYNLRLRREPVLDLAAVASGFVIRAVAGGLATGVRLSEWFLVVISFASLFVVAGKREAASPRIDYPPGFLRYVRLLGSGVAVTAYCLWAFEKAESAGGGVWFQLTIVPFVLAILRYALRVERGAEEAPEDLLLGDRAMLALAVVWAALFSVGVYGA